MRREGLSVVDQQVLREWESGKLLEDLNNAKLEYGARSYTSEDPQVRFIHDIHDVYNDAASGLIVTPERRRSSLAFFSRRKRTVLMA